MPDLQCARDTTQLKKLERSLESLPVSLAKCAPNSSGIENQFRNDIFTLKKGLKLKVSLWPP